MQADWPQRWLRDALGIVPRDLSLYAAALTHRSAASRNNERLEFLGDAVLNLLIAETLYARFPIAPEGDLSRLRARLVSAEPLANIALGLGLGDALQLGSGELKTGGFRRESILSDALEAVIGASYLDAGLEATRTLVARLFSAALEDLPDVETLKDPKTRLQERLQARGFSLPTYTVEKITGEPHEQTFAVRCEVAALGLEFEGEGSSRRRAEQDAATRLLAALDTDGRA
jgi:ribonuclease-3